MTKQIIMKQYSQSQKEKKKVGDGLTKTGIRNILSAKQAVDVIIGTHGTRWYCWFDKSFTTIIHI